MFASCCKAFGYDSIISQMTASPASMAFIVLFSRLVGRNPLPNAGLALISHNSFLPRTV